MLKSFLIFTLIILTTASASERAWNDLVAGVPSDTIGKHVTWIPPCPLPKKSGVIWRSQPYTHIEDTWIRLHFVFDNLPSKAAWRIDIKGSNSQVLMSITQENLQTKKNQIDLWSEKVPGNGIRVELNSNGDDLGDFCPLVDLIKYPIAPVAKYSQFGKYSWEDITTLGTQHRKYKIGQSVARIIIPDTNGNDNNCTGFLVSRDRMFTNSHCFHNVDLDQICSDDKLKVHFNEETGQKIQPVDCQEVEVNYQYLDLAIVKLKTPPQFNRRPLTLSRRLPIQKGAPDARGASDKLSIIQHPALDKRFLKQIVRRECERHGELLAGAYTDSEGTVAYPQPDFGHECDTNGGSSGSPVIDENDYVVGLHHWGKENSPSTYNRAVAMSTILQWLQGNHKSIFDQLQVVGP